MNEEMLEKLSDTQPLHVQRKLPEETLRELQKSYLEILNVVESAPHQAIVLAEGLVREMFLLLFWQRTGEDASGMKMKDVFLAVRDMVPGYVQVEMETIGFAYQHALHDAMVNVTRVSDAVVAGLEGLEIIFDWFEETQLSPSKPVSALSLSKTVPLSTKSYDKSLAALSEYLENYPKDVDALLNRGVLYNNMRKVTRALADFDAGIEQDASVAELYFHRGNSYQLLGDFEKALENYQYALDLNLESAALYHARGMVYTKMGNVGQAYVNFDLAMAIEKRYAESKRAKKLLKKKKRFSLFKFLERK